MATAFTSEPARHPNCLFGLRNKSVACRYIQTNSRLANRPNRYAVSTLRPILFNPRISMNRNPHRSSRAPRKPAERIARQTSKPTDPSTTLSSASSTTSSSTSSTTSLYKPKVGTRAPLNAGQHSPESDELRSGGAPHVTSRGTPLGKILADPAAEIAVAPVASSTPPPFRGVDRIIEAVKAERADRLDPTGPTRTRGASLVPFNTFLDLLLEAPLKEWPSLFNQARLSPTTSASHARSFALYFLETQTDGIGLGKAEHGQRYLALISACLLGYDLDTLWVGTALKGYRPAEAALWRALSGNA
ncbi:MAG: hypothetical protein JWR21_3467 [Herminiimonas sp.]|nr:hypothetical protein [Herminiimonas sp.]